MRAFKVLNFKDGYSSEFIQHDDNKKMHRMGKNFADIDLHNDLNFFYEILDLEEEVRKNTEVVNKYIDDLTQQAQGLDGTDLLELKAKSVAVHKRLHYQFKLFDAQADGYSITKNYDSPYLYTIVRVFGERVNVLEQLFDDRLDNRLCK